MPVSPSKWAGLLSTEEGWTRAQHQYEERAYCKHLTRRRQDEKEDPKTSQKGEQTQAQISGQERDRHRASERQLWV